MSVNVVLPKALLNLFPGSDREFHCSAATVDEVLDTLNAKWPGMRDRLCDSTPRIRRNINIFVEGEKATLLTSLSEGAEVIIMTAISGGRKI